MSEIHLLQGDCRDIVPTLTGVSVVITDPPFNIGFDYEGYRDNLSDADYVELIARLKAFERLVVIHYPEESFRYVYPALGCPDDVIAWVYNGHTKRRFRLITTFGMKPDFSKVLQPFKNPNDKRIKAKVNKGVQGVPVYDWWHIEQVKNVSKDKTEHPCQMPLEVMERIVLTCTSEGDTVLDPFMGSGTTGVACVNLGRNFIGIEKASKYFKIAERRITDAQLQAVTA
jgi:site-specific DNA-methyltransferase (adenine-specific)